MVISVTVWKWDFLSFSFLHFIWTITLNDSFSFPILFIFLFQFFKQIAYIHMHTHFHTHTHTHTYTHTHRMHSWRKLKIIISWPGNQNSWPRVFRFPITPYFCCRGKFISYYWHCFTWWGTASHPAPTSGYNTPRLSFLSPAWLLGRGDVSGLASLGEELGMKRPAPPSVGVCPCQERVGPLALSHAASSGVSLRELAGEAGWLNHAG